MIRWHLTGNRPLATIWIPEAKRLLFNLNNVLAGVPTGWLRRSYPDGTQIEVGQVFGQEIARISSPFPTGGFEEIIKETLVFLYGPRKSDGKMDYMFYKMAFPTKIIKVGYPSDFGHKDEDSNVNLGALGYVINKPQRKFHIITLGTPFANWDLVQDNLSDEGIGKFPITVLWNVPSICTHARIRGGSEELKWGTCGYEGDAIVPVPPIHSMTWPFRSILPFSYAAKKRTMNPIGGCWIPIRVNNQVVWQEDPQYTGLDWGISGKRNFKLNPALSEALSWRDTLQVSGVGTSTSSGSFTADGSPAGGLLVVTYGWYPYPSASFFWKPWYSWLHEVPTFDYFDANSFPTEIPDVDNSDWDLEPRSPYKYRRKFKTASGDSTIDSIFTEILNNVYNPVSSASSSDVGTDGRCTAGTEGESHSFSITSGGYGGSSSGTLYTPIASLGDGKYLYIHNVFGASMSHEGKDKYGSEHQDNLPCGWHVCEQNFQLDCSCLDSDGGHSHHDFKTETWTGDWGTYDTTNHIGLAQKLILGSAVIEQCVNLMSYTLKVLTFTGTYAWEFAHADPVSIPGGIACPYTVDNSGSQSQNTRTDTENWSRSMEFVEVLDYDNIGTDTAIVIYKKVAIAHSVGFSYTGDGVNVAAADFPYSTEKADYTWAGTRTVTYWVWVKIGTYTTKFQIPNSFIGTCAGSYGTDGNTESQAGAGQRVYGVSCQINNDFIVYSYTVEDFSAGSAGYHYYSSPLNWEDRNNQGIAMDGFPAWAKNKMVLGAVKISTHERAAFDITQYTDQKVYSVGMHQSERVEAQA